MSKNAAQWRKGLITKIQIGKGQLGMEDDVYHEALMNRYGVQSSTKLSLRELEDFVAFLELRGAVFTSKGKRAPKPSQEFYEIPDGTHFPAQKRWIAAMWKACGWKMSGLDARSKKQFGVDQFVWIADQSQLQTLAKDLQNRCRGKGLDPENLRCC